MNTNELYKKMKNKVKGKVFLEKDYIKWIFPNEVVFKIYFGDPEGYICVVYKNYNLTHFHPYSDEIFDDIMYLNNDIYWVKKKKIFGYSKPFFIEKSEYNSFDNKKKDKYIVI